MNRTEMLWVTVLLVASTITTWISTTSSNQELMLQLRQLESHQASMQSSIKTLKIDSDRDILKLHEQYKSLLSQQNSFIGELAANLSVHQRSLTKMERLLESMEEHHKYYLSVVVVARNDNYGGNLRIRLLNWLQLLLYQAHKLELDLEVRENPHQNRIARIIQWTTHNIATHTAHHTIQHTTTKCY